jgi:hypothetical protein
MLVKTSPSSIHDNNGRVRAVKLSCVSRTTLRSFFSDSLQASGSMPTGFTPDDFFTV